MTSAKLGSVIPRSASRREYCPAHSCRVQHSCHVYVPVVCMTASSTQLGAPAVACCRQSSHGKQAYLVHGCVQPESSVRTILYGLFSDCSHHHICRWNIQQLHAALPCAGMLAGVQLQMLCALSVSAAFGSMEVACSRYKMLIITLLLQSDTHTHSQ